MKILFLIPQLEYHGAAKQLVLLATGLPRPPFEVLVCVLGGDAPFAPLLKSAGVTVANLDWRRPFDLKPWFRLRRLWQDFRPDIVHAWRPLALRALNLAAGLRTGPIVLSAPLGSAQPLGWLDRQLLGRVNRIVVHGTTEAKRCRALGVADKRLTFVPPAVTPVPAESLPRPSWLPDSHRCIVCMGALEPHKGLRDALWAFDILRFMYDDLHLLLIGSGAERDWLLHFARRIGAADFIHLLGSRADGPQLLSWADVVWVPDRIGGGVNVALEAMAAARPIVASRRGSLAELIVEGQTGCLFEPGDKTALARHTRLLLEDAGRRRQLGEAGRQRRAANDFTVSELVPLRSSV